MGDSRIAASGHIQLMISPEEMEEALRRSGYLLEGRIDALLSKHGYYVSPNFYYIDPSSGKAREIDLHALQMFRAGKGDQAFVWSLCLIECVNSLEPIAFFTRPDPAPFLRRALIQLAGLPVRLLTGRDTWTPAPEVLKMEAYHHYCTGPIANQFCSFSPKKNKPGEWLAQHLDDHFSTFTKLLDAVRHCSNELADCWIDAGDAKFEHLNVEFLYPILVVSGAPIHEVIQHKDQLDIREVDHILYRAAGVSNQYITECLVDVVTETAFPSFVEMLGREMKNTARRIRRREASVDRSLHRLYEEVKTMTSDQQKLRRMMQYSQPGQPDDES